MLPRQRYLGRKRALLTPISCKRCRSFEETKIPSGNNNRCRAGTTLSISRCCFAIGEEPVCEAEVSSHPKLERTAIRANDTPRICSLLRKPSSSTGKSARHKDKTRAFRSSRREYRFCWK